MMLTPAQRSFDTALELKVQTNSKLDELSKVQAENLQNFPRSEPREQQAMLLEEKRLGDEISILQTRFGMEMQVANFLSKQENDEKFIRKMP